MENKKNNSNNIIYIVIAFVAFIFCCLIICCLILLNVFGIFAFNVSNSAIEESTEEIYFENESNLEIDNSETQVFEDYPSSTIFISITEFDLKDGDLLRYRIITENDYILYTYQFYIDFNDVVVDSDGNATLELKLNSFSFPQGYYPKKLEIAKFFVEQYSFVKLNTLPILK